MLRLEITQKELDDYVAVRLRSVGFDLTKEIKCHALLGPNETLTQVYTQEENAPPNEKERAKQRSVVEQQELQSKRPEWLKEI